MQIFYFILFLLGLSIVGYFFGGILFGNVYARIRGENIHELGSKNPGATNVRRLYGRTAGFIVAFLDAIKGYLVVVLSYIIFTYAIVKTIKIGSDTSNLWPCVFVPGFFVMLGHCFPLRYIVALWNNNWNKEACKNFSGGKGVSTCGGLIFAMSPWCGLICLGFWIIITFSTKFVSLASMLTLLLAPILFLIPHLDYIYMCEQFIGGNKHNLVGENYIYCICLMLINLSQWIIVVIKHKDNIIRLLNHSERKIGHNKI